MNLVKYWPRLPLLLLAGLLVVKIAGLAIFGPLQQSDSLAYLDYANTIYSDTNWLSDAGMEKSAAPQTTFRPFGYPALIALARVVKGDWVTALYLVVLVQFMFSLVATVMVYQLGQALLRNSNLALIAATGHALSVTLAYDQHILTDSLFNALSVIGFTVPVIGFLRKIRPGFCLMFGFGVILAAACLIRGIGIYVLVVFAPAWIAMLWAAHERLTTTVISSVLLMLPLLAVIGGVTAWNNWRTGYSFFTTGSQYVLIQSLVKIEGRGTRVFVGDEPLDHLARKYLKTYEYDEVVRITEALFSEYGINAYESANMHTEKYFNVLFSQPGVLLYHGLRNYEEGLVHQFFNVLDNTKVYLKFATGERPWPGMKKLWERVKTQRHPLDIVLMVLLSLLRLISWLSFLILVLGVPVLIIRTLYVWRRIPPDTLAVFYLWGLYCAYSFGLCMIHMVDRFLPAVLAAGLIGTLFVWQRLSAQLNP